MPHIPKKRANGHFDGNKKPIHNVINTILTKLGNQITTLSVPTDIQHI
jgi:hypothetical protein